MDLQLEYLTRTNIIPSDSEARNLKILLGVAERDVIEFNLEIVRMQQLLEDLVNRRDQRNTEVTAYKRALSPVRRLPPEVVAEIFVHCLSGPVNLPSHPSDPPLLLCQICSGWRRVALGTPKLWSSISLCFKAPYIISGLLGLANSWLSRSGTSALAIHLSVDDFNIKFDLNPVCDIIIPFSSRLKEIHLTLPFHYVIPLLVLPPDSMESLEVLYLQTLDAGISYFIRSKTGVFGTASRLRDVTLKFVPIVEAVSLPWPKLTHLDLTGSVIQTDTCHTILHQCTNLISCVMKVTHETNSPVHGPPTFLPSLKSFKLFLDLPRFSGVGTFFEAFVFPVLEDFEAASRRPLRWSQSAFAFISSLSFLKNLSLSQGIVFKGRELVASLQTMKYLERLGTFDGKHTIDDFIISMVCCPDFLPCLEVITFVLRGHKSNRDVHCIAEMVRFRRRSDLGLVASGSLGPTFLKQVTFVCDDIDYDPSSYFREAIATGLIVSCVSWRALSALHAENGV